MLRMIDTVVRTGLRPMLLFRGKRRLRVKHHRLRIISCLLLLTRKMPDHHKMREHKHNNSRQRQDRRREWPE